jgi:hypothetical protein
MIAQSLFICSLKKAAKNLASNLLNNLFSRLIFNFSPRWNLSTIFLYWPFLVCKQVRMNIDLKLMKRMVQSVFGVDWSVYNE